ncbi:glutamate decarboxylase [Microbacterium mangrovi]|uniref:Glutamate decarboxylase n=1 Tax=Microbacterium mangrovi TaxID=1348253 RepID=A0A0B2A6N5_9MICO|nr:glutamate decarboxylase [Microbacterium mangrovi]KHK97208.1 glutamate decarboxylase [Microbacterium mangrovi]
MADEELIPVFDRLVGSDSIERNRLGEKSLLPETAYQVVHDESLLDGNARLNLATFVTTWMDDHANRLYAESYDKNMIDKDEYPSTASVEEHCWRILADLWHAPSVENAIGCSTTGSSEACMLGGLAFKRRWQHARRAAGKSTEKPNLIMSSAVQVCWEKFCNYFDVEARYVPVSEEHPVLDGHDLEKYVDENTIGVVVIMGQTYIGAYEPVQKVADALDAIQASTGLDIPIHVDGASGAMIAPFLQPELEWDFRVPRVHSISTSAHKYGAVYPGLGWVVWRDLDALPDDLIFRVSYLGGSMPTFALNFSRPGAQVLLQYYAFLRLGHEGFRAMQGGSRAVAEHLSSKIAEMGPFKLRSTGSDIPVFAWELDSSVERNWNLYHLSDRLRMRGWLVPTYPMPPDLEEILVQRVVVRADFSRDMADKLLNDIAAEVDYLEKLESPMPVEGQTPHFAH